MKTSDKLFVSIIIGIVILSAISLIISFNSKAAEYKDESSPEGVAQNYLLAIQKEDYDRAYGYLSETIENLPANTKQFENDLNLYGYVSDRISKMVFSIEAIDQENEEAKVILTSILLTEDGLLGGFHRRDQITINLVLEHNHWKIIDCDDYRFFDMFWNNPF